MIDIFIPSYHRAKNLKTVKYFLDLGWKSDKLHVFIDTEDDQVDLYRAESDKHGFHLHIFDIDKARSSYDFLHRPNPNRRTAGLTRNAMYDISHQLKIKQFVIIDDDTQNYQLQPFGIYRRKAEFLEVIKVFECVKVFMDKQRLGIFGLSQTGDMFAKSDTKILRNKVMNTTFVHTDYVDCPEKGILDSDTASFVEIMNAGLFTGSLRSGLVLSQSPSATQKGGLTDSYKQRGLLSKALETPIMRPSLAVAQHQPRNGGRIHHRIKYKNLFPKLMKGERGNIAWDTYPEDIKFTNKRQRNATN